MGSAEAVEEYQQHTRKGSVCGCVKTTDWFSKCTNIILIGSVANALKRGRKQRRRQFPARECLLRVNLVLELVVAV